MAAALALTPQSGLSPRYKSEQQPMRMKFKGSPRRSQLEDMSLPQTPQVDDPLRILAPGQKKLTTIESQRVLAAMDETIKRMEGVMVIPLLTSSLDRYSITLGSELVQMLKTYNRLVGEYNRLYESLEGQGIVPDLVSFTSEVDFNDSFGPESVSTSGLQDYSRSPSTSQSSLISSGRPVQLEPLERDDESTSTQEARFQKIRLRLKHCVKCILRELQRNPASSRIMSASGERPKSAMLLQDKMTYV